MVILWEAGCYILAAVTAHVIGNTLYVCVCSVRPALLRLLAGGVYTLVFQLGYLFFPDAIFTSDSFRVSASFSASSTGTYITSVMMAKVVMQSSDHANKA